MSDVATLEPKNEAAVTGRAVDANPLQWLRGEIDQVFDNVQRLFPLSLDRGNDAGPAPALELFDEGNSYRLSAELPGLSVDEISLDVVNGVLILAGEKRIETERDQADFLVKERRYGTFSRQVALPADVDPQAIKAKFKHGVLSVKLGKDENSKTRIHKISIDG